MTKEEYIRNRLDMINRNSVYGLYPAISSEIAKIVHYYIERGIGTEYDRFNSPPPPIYIGPVKIKTLKERLEETKMKTTSTQVIKNVNDICFSIESNPIEMESKLTVVASTNDDVFEFEFEGPDIIRSCKKTGLFTGWEKDQKIKELEKEIDELKEKNGELVRENEKNIKRFDYVNRKLNRVMKDEKTIDNVNHPSHYTGRYECIDVMQDVFGDEATDNFCLCNAFKYIWRARKKNGLEDVKKAIWYLNKYIEEAEKDGVQKEEQIQIPTRQ